MSEAREPGAHPDLLKQAGPNLGFAPPRGSESPRRGMFASLAHRQYRRYWAGLFLSNIGTWMQTVAQGWLVLRLSNSAVVLGLVGFAGSIPTLLLAPLAGVAADRLDRRKLLLVTQATQMTCAFTLAAATGLRFVSVPLVAGVAIVNGIANAFTTPSHQSLFLDLVGREDLTNAIALNSMQFNLSRVVGPMLAGLTIGALGEAACFGLNGLSFVAILVPLATLPPLPRSKRRALGAWIELRSGVRYARRHPLIPQLLAIAAAIAIFGTPVVTMAPLFARRLLGVGPEGLGGMLTAVGVGAVATALLMASRGDFGRKGFGVLLASSAFAVALAGFSLSRSYPLSLALLAVVGASMTSMASLVNTLLQKAAPDRMRGRVLSLYAVAWLGLVPIGNLQAGAVAERFGSQATLLAGAAAIAVTLIVVRLVRPLPGSAA